VCSQGAQELPEGGQRIQCDSCNTTTLIYHIQ
jgi:hypothetical protein